MASVNYFLNILILGGRRLGNSNAVFGIFFDSQENCEFQQCSSFSYDYIRQCMILHWHAATTSTLHIYLLTQYSNGRARVVQGVRQMDYLTTHTSLSPIRRGIASGFVNYKKRCTRLAAACEKAYQLLAYSRWFSPGTPTSSTTETGRHDIAKLLLKVTLNTINHQINHSNGNSK